MGAHALHDYWLLQNLRVIPIQEPSLSQHIAKRQTGSSWPTTDLAGSSVVLSWTTPENTECDRDKNSPPEIHCHHSHHEHCTLKTDGGSYGIEVLKNMILSSFCLLLGANGRQRILGIHLGSTGTMDLDQGRLLFPGGGSHVVLGIDLPDQRRMLENLGFTWTASGCPQ